MVQDNDLVPRSNNQIGPIDGQSLLGDREPQAGLIDETHTAVDSLNARASQVPMLVTIQLDYIDYDIDD
jgi:hypothetical protein